MENRLIFKTKNDRVFLFIRVIQNVRISIFRGGTSENFKIINSKKGELCILPFV